MSQAGGQERLDDLVRRARAGDDAALGELIEHHRPLLVHIAARQIGTRVRERSDAADVVQETALAIHRDFPHFRGVSAAEFLSWARRILDRVISGTIRAHVLTEKRAVTSERSIDASSSSIVALRERLRSPDRSPSQKAVSRQEARRLLKALERLPENQRDAVSMRHLEGWSLTEIAAKMNRSELAVASLIKRGLAQLRRDLES
jgi:RNA polymerase sigma-70 factor (ECF subfamily)